MKGLMRECGKVEEGREERKEKRKGTVVGAKNRTEQHLFVSLYQQMAL